MVDDKIRITFACSEDLRDALTKRSDKEGIPRSQLIVELLEGELSSPDEGKGRDAAVKRLLFDIQSRVGLLEGWRREVASWSKSQSTNAENLEEAVAYLLNENLTEGGDIGRKITKKKSIPSPVKKKV